MANWVMEAKESHDTLSANWTTRKAGHSVIETECKGLGTSDVRGQEKKDVPAQ